MGEEQQQAAAMTSHERQALGVSLGPVLHEVCEGRLGSIEWFRSTWQMGGAATGFAEWTDGDGQTRPVMVKLPVGFREYLWTLRLGAVDREAWAEGEAMARPTPRVVAAGEELGGYDLAWLVIERLPGHPLSSTPSKAGLEAVLATAAEFHDRAGREEAPGKPPDPPDWPSLIGRGRESVQVSGIAQPQRWKQALKRVQKVLPSLMERWSSRPINCWCHGDLHPGNAMWRPIPSGLDIGEHASGGNGGGNGAKAPSGIVGPECCGKAGEDVEACRCVLIDLALVHAGHWIEDAVYLERLHWGTPERLEGLKPVSALAKARKARGLCNGEEYNELANTRRVLMAACVPALLEREGHPKHVAAALELLERLLPQFGAK